MSGMGVPSRWCACASVAPALILLCEVHACAPAYHPHPIEEVPIGLSISSDPARPETDSPPSEGAPDASLPGFGAVEDAQAEAAVADVPDAEGGGPKKRTGVAKASKAPVPVAVTGGTGGGGAESERARLEAKVANHEATPADFRALMKICAKQHDQACVRKVIAASRAH
jgi:hypothetical protein